MNILVTKGWYEAPLHLDEIKAMGHTVYYIEHEEDALPCEPSIIDGVVCCKVFNFHPIEEFTKLKFIQTESVGYDRVPFEYAKAHGIKVYNVGATYAGPMSEYVICRLLDWYQNSAQERENQANRVWFRNHNKQELSGKTVCIIGTGNIAQYTAKKLKGFDCKVYAISHTARDVEYIDEVRSYSILHETLKESDIVIIATSRDAVEKHMARANAKAIGTTGASAKADATAAGTASANANANTTATPLPAGPVIGAAELAVMKNTAVLVNVARGPQVDEEALISALQSGSIEAAILDVFVEEPLATDSPLWDCENAILTPHSSYIGEGNADRLWNVIKSNLLKELG